MKASVRCPEHVLLQEGKKTGDNHEDKEDEDVMEEKSLVLSLDLNISFGDNGDDQCSLAEYGILESVDRQVVFKIQELS